MFNFRVVIAMSIASALMGGCCTFGLGCKLAPDQQKQVDNARKQCNFVDVNKSELTLKLMPVVDGKSLPEVSAQLGNNSKADFVIYETLWHQDACVIQALSKDMPFGRVTAWDKEITEAFTAVPKNPAGSYDEKIRQIYTARDSHLGRLKEKDTSRTGLLDFDMFTAAIPQDDFLKVETLHTQITFPENYLIKGKNVAKSTVSGDLAPGQFSEEIRPALQVIRSNLAAYALGKASEKEILEATVASIYDAAANKVRNSNAEPAAGVASAAEQKKETGAGEKEPANAKASPQA
ncbi:MAG: hypothetical protein ACXWC4_10765 [Telluria sp.]